MKIVCYILDSELKAHVLLPLSGNNKDDKQHTHE